MMTSNGKLHSGLHGLYKNILSSSVGVITISLTFRNAHELTRESKDNLNFKILSGMVLTDFVNPGNR